MLDFTLFSAQSAHTIPLVLLQFCPMSLASPDSRKSLELLGWIGSTHNLRSPTVSLIQTLQTAVAPPLLSFPSKHVRDALCLSFSSRYSQRTFPCVSHRLLKCSLGFLSTFVLHDLMSSLLESLWHDLAHRSVGFFVTGPLNYSICSCLSWARR